MEPKHIRALCFIAGAMLLLAVLEWPYGYYRLLRIVVCGIGALAAWRLYEDGRVSVAAISAVGAVIFNPLFPLTMEREQWALFNIAFAAGFAVVGWNVGLLKAASDS